MDPSDTLFVTSTGTEVGKTLLSRLIVAEFLDRGLETGYFKSVASGCEQSQWGYRSPDEVEIIRETGLSPDHVTASFRFEAPLSPDRAAEREDRSFTIQRILDRLRDFQTSYDRVVVEGIGGVAVPFNDREDVTDLVGELGEPALLVADSTLGTISYTRTAVHYLERVGIAPAGIMLTPGRGREIESVNRNHLRSLYPGIAVELLPDVDTTASERVSDCLNRFLEGSGCP